MPVNIEPLYTKRTWEQETIKIDWKKRSESLVIDGYTISSIDVEVFRGAINMTSQMIAETPYFVGTDIFITVKNGTSKYTYDCIVQVTFKKDGSADQLQEGVLSILVDDSKTS